MIPDVAVVGGGLLGCAVARVLAAAGRRVAVIEPGPLCRGASWAAAGMLGVPLELDAPPALRDLCRRSRALFPDWVAALREETGIDPEFARAGSLWVALEEEDEAWLEAAWASVREHALAVERVDADALARWEPWLRPSCRGGLHLPDDARVNNRRLCEAVAASLEARGVALWLGRPAAGLVRDGSAVAGVRLAGGEVVRAGAVVLAAGAWSGQLDGLPRPLPVEPRRGQMLALRAPANAVRRTLVTRDVYLVPRVGGTLLVGATVERVGFDARVTADGLAALLGRALRLAPRLADAEFVEAWAGLRPATPDGLPVLGPDPEVSGLVYATGHFRNGILLAPITAKVVADHLLGRGPAFPLDAFRPDRFPAPAASP